jgi:ABC-type multidrug transport system permease subunit
MYFMVGDLSEPGPTIYLDYFWKAPHLSKATVTSVGVIAMIVMLVSILAIAIALGRERDQRRSSSPCFSRQR